MAACVQSTERSPLEDSVKSSSVPVTVQETVPPSTTTSTLLTHTTISILVTDQEGNPVEGVSAGSSTTTGPDGSVVIQRPDGGITFTAPGFIPQHRQVPDQGDLSVVLQPVVLEGIVKSESGQTLPDVVVSLDGVSTTTNDLGRFLFTGLPAGTIRVEIPAAEIVEISWLGLASWVPITVNPVVVRGLHVGGWAVGDAEHWQRLLDLTADSEVNSLAVDLKDESGLVFYPSEVAFANQIEAIRSQYELDDLVATAAELDFYLIGRIVTFQDPIAARAAPEIAVQTASGAPFSKNGQYFLDPTDPEARRYSLDLATEACMAGFDEIQFDYVRYPDGFGRSAVFDGGAGSDERPQVIKSFLAEASAALNPLGCAVAADIFGFITSTPNDGGIGQQLEELAEVVDVLSPMLYPSHYSEGWFGFEVPNDHPGPVVAAALDDGIERLGSSVVIRPWIQDFYYNSAQVRQQIDAAEERELGWMLWNVFSRFAEGALNPVE